MQCALYDGNTNNANLNGLEYIISERLFESLPEEEKQYWHPHNGEILSGQLVAPGLPEAADHALMKSKMNSYGKTWHTWDTSHNGGPSESLPLGKPQLAWSFNRFGEAKPGLVESRDRRMNINTEERRRARRDLIKEANPQAGVDALKGQFEGPTQPIPGVVEAKVTPSLTAREKEQKLKTIVVQPGDTLSSIALRIYGDPNKWRRIYRANQQKINNPDLITVGAELALPPKNNQETDSSEGNRGHKK